jgi:hypothetical protein
MSDPVLSVRELKETDLDLIINYWLNSGKAFMESMGVDVLKIPSGEQWREMLAEQLKASQ